MQNLFETSININNKIIGKINNVKLMNIDIQIPNEQRIKDEDKINEIIEYQEAYFKKNNCFNFLGVINIHKYNDKYFLVDGQHRYYSLKTMTNMGYSKIDIFVELIEINNLDILKENYSIINKNTELPEFPDHIDKNIPEDVAKYFFERYPNIWSTTKRVRRPHINKNYFQEALGVLTDKLKIESSPKLRNIVENYNTRISNWDIQNFPNYKTFKDPKKIEEKCKDTGIYLGLFPHKTDEYGYDWVKKIIYEQTGKEVKVVKKILTVKIPKKVRIDSWNTYIGKEIGSIKCICCRNTEISQSNFHAGHILAKSKGGANTVENIIPICSHCNLSMGNKNMEDFIAEYYPNNLDNFQKRKYVIDLNQENNGGILESTKAFLGFSN